MHTNVVYVESDSSFNPNVYALFIRENGSMKDEVYNLTVYEVKQLIEQLQIMLKRHDNE